MKLKRCSLCDEIKSFFVTTALGSYYEIRLPRAISVMRCLLRDGLPRSVCVRRLCRFGVLRFATCGTAKLMMEITAYTYYTYTYRACPQRSSCAILYQIFYKNCAQCTIACFPCVHLGTALPLSTRLRFLLMYSLIYLQ